MNENVRSWSTLMSWLECWKAANKTAYKSLLSPNPVLPEIRTPEDLTAAVDELRIFFWSGEFSSVSRHTMYELESMYISMKTEAEILSLCQFLSTTDDWLSMADLSGVLERAGAAGIDHPLIEWVRSTLTAMKRQRMLLLQLNLAVNKKDWANASKLVVSLECSDTLLLHPSIRSIYLTLREEVMDSMTSSGGTSDRQGSIECRPERRMSSPSLTADPYTPDIIKHQEVDDGSFDYPPIHHKRGRHLVAAGFLREDDTTDKPKGKFEPLWDDFVPIAVQFVRSDPASLRCPNARVPVFLTERSKDPPYTLSSGVGGTSTKTKVIGHLTRDGCFTKKLSESSTESAPVIPTTAVREEDTEHCLQTHLRRAIRRTKNRMLKWERQSQGIEWRLFQ
eukprot:GHVO01017703.1.p1 GENE.GHVO01017703.1~~GHVO01017703.1.p1  ORF type:complete len:401 (-),score=75.91 GHVO01017703.1:270-1448(-)